MAKLDHFDRSLVASGMGMTEYYGRKRYPKLWGLFCEQLKSLLNVQITHGYYVLTYDENQANLDGERTLRSIVVPSGRI
eukprot:scaffold7100_cov95-Cylindrotheca_fusiformis.AAC.5